MENKNKEEILLMEFSKILPYGVKIETEYFTKATLIEIRKNISYGACKDLLVTYDISGKETPYQSEERSSTISKIKPYLFPLSSMTEEQKEELINITNGKFRYMCGDITNAIPRKNISEWGISENAYINSIKVINILYIWLLKNHFDINGLIPMGLAKDTTGLNIY